MNTFEHLVKDHVIIHNKYYYLQQQEDIAKNEKWLFLIGSNQHSFYAIDIYKNELRILPLDIQHNTPNLTTYEAVVNDNTHFIRNVHDLNNIARTTKTLSTYLMGSVSINNTFNLHNIATSFHSAIPTPIWLHHLDFHARTFLAQPAVAGNQQLL
eukprot:UN08148